MGAVVVPQMDTYDASPPPLDYNAATTWGTDGMQQLPVPGMMASGGGGLAMMSWKDIGRVAIVIAILYIAIEYSPITSFVSHRLGQMGFARDMFSDDSSTHVVVAIIKACVLAGTFVGVVKFANL